MTLNEFIRQLFAGTLVLPPQKPRGRGLRREHGGSFSTLEGTLLWVYLNRDYLDHMTPTELLFSSPFFWGAEHTHSYDRALENCTEAFDDHEEDVQRDAFNNVTFQT